MESRPTGPSPERIATHLAGWIADEVRDSGGRGVTFGLSGGIDSAVVAGLSARAFPGHALGVIMPCHSDPQDEADARLTAEAFAIDTVRVDLGRPYDALLAEIAAASADVAEDRMACANIKPRLRMTTLYAFANLLGYRVLGTGNRSELAIGYFTKYGDGGVDFLPIGSLTKTQVRALAEHLGVPRPVIDKPPSAGLWAGQTDEHEMGLTYEELDACLVDPEGQANERVDALVAGARHKRELPKVAPLPD